MAEDDWSSSANDSINISICQAGVDAPKALASFHPEFTEPFFGQNQSIFGYKNLSIDLRFAAYDLYPNVRIGYDEKFKSVGGTKATNLLKIFKEYLPQYAFDEPATFNTKIQNDTAASSFTPPGQLVASYTANGRQYGIWLGELTDPAVKIVIERMQVLISFYIDGGLSIPLDDQEWTLARWRVFLVYEKHASPPPHYGSPYSIVGYSTSYRFLTYKPSSATQSAPAQPFVFPPVPISVSSLPNRSRISQFLILPHHQHCGHGSHLYNTMIQTFLSDPACLEITVEDPNESFDDLRDYCDYARLFQLGTLAPFKMNTALDPKCLARKPGLKVPTFKMILPSRAAYDTTRTTQKIAPRQFARLVEMHLLKQIPLYSRQGGKARLTQKEKAKDPGDRAYWMWRLLVKQRIFKQHRDLLLQLEWPERIEKLEETLETQTRDYERLLDRIANGPQRREEQGGEGSASGSSSGMKRKRMIVDDGEDEGD